METEQLAQLLDVANRVGGAAWAAAVRGIQVEAAIDLVLGVVGLAAMGWVARRYTPGVVDEYRDDECSDAFMVLVAGALVLGIGTCACLLALRFSLVALAAPEWAAIRALISATQ